jgi:transcription elongation factor Elf1
MKIIKLPVPIFTDPIIKECEILKPTTGVIMETKKVIDTGDHFLALKKFLEGSILIKDSQEKTKQLVGELSIQSAEYLAIQVMLLHYPEDDGIEGIYQCPRCGQEKICECVDDIDNRDFISELEVTYLEEKIEITKDINIELIDRKTGNILLEVNSLTMRFPVLKDYIQAANKVGHRNDVDTQKNVYVSCITKLNGEEITREDRNKYGNKIIEKLDPRDMNYFAKQILEYGMNTYVTKVCNHCGKEWKTKINTSNFFVSALQ